MRRAERIAVYTACCISVVLALRATGLDAPAHATSAAPLAEPAARIATLDTLAATEALFSSEAYAPARKSEEDRLKSRLTPMETELDALQKELQAADPSKAENQAKAQSFQTKRDEYFRLRKELSESYDKIVSSQFADAYERVEAAAKLVADENNYTHVLSHKPGRLTGQDPQRLIADLLSRPVVVRPQNTDITEKVLAQLKVTPSQSEPRQ